MTRWLDVEDIRLGSFELAITHPWDGGEPIPSFDTRFPGILESCLYTPQQCFGDQELYPTLIDKASILFYLLNKNHPFQNGNKRVALLSLLLFLYLNGKWLRTGITDLYNLSVLVAASPPEQMNEYLACINSFIETFVIDSARLKVTTP